MNQIGDRPKAKIRKTYRARSSHFENIGLILTLLYASADSFVMAAAAVGLAAKIQNW